MNVRKLMLLLTGTIILNIVPLNAQTNWPGWRGPDLNGVSQAKKLPLTWSETENIVWKVPLPSWSGATPIIWEDKIFVMTPSKEENEEDLMGEDRRGRRRVKRAGGSKILLWCLSKTNGDLIWEVELASENELHNKQNSSSPSPVTDGKHVWTVTGSGRVAAFDMKGSKVWTTDLQKTNGEFRQKFGYASSPLLYDGKLIIEVIHGWGDDPSYVVAFDAATGKVLWKVSRPTDAPKESADAYTTPALLKTDGKTQIVILGGDVVTGHNPNTGNEIWRAGGLNPRARQNYRIIASPVVVGEMIYAPTRKTPLLAFRAGGRGDVTESHFVWKYDSTAATDVPTPAVDEKYFYMADDRGKMTCLDAQTGRIVWGPESTERGIVSASPLLADGKVYMTNENGVTTVFKAGPKMKKLSVNILDDQYTLSSIAVSENRLYIRTSSHLYCVGEK